MDVDALRHHADHRVAPTRGPSWHLFPEHAGIAAKCALPKSVTDDDRSRGVALNNDFVRFKPSAEKRLDSEDVERLIVHLLEPDAFGSIRTRHRKADKTEKPECDSVKGAGVSLPVLDPILGQAAQATFGVSLVDPDKPLGIGKWQRREDRGVQDTENRRRRTNT